jgi:hypothetical protein
MPAVRPFVTLRSVMERWVVRGRFAVGWPYGACFACDASHNSAHFRVYRNAAAQCC